LIIFTKARWKNFLSTGNVFTEITLDQYINTLITGANGSGKSTILDVLCFGLYSKPFRKVKKDQLTNSINSSGTMVEVEFRTNGKTYKIVRGSKPNKFEIWEDGKLQDQHGHSRDQQNHLEDNIIRMNMKSFTQMVILGSSSFVPFMQLSPNVRREVIEDLLDIRIFSTMSILLKERTSVNKQELILNQKDLDSVGSLIEMQERQSKLNSEKQNERLEYYKDRRQDIQERIHLAEQNAEVSQKAVNGLVDKIFDESTVHDKIGRVVKIEGDLDKKKKLTKRNIEFYEKNDHCPTCTQEIDLKIKTEKIKEKTEVISEIDKAMTDLEIELAGLNQRTLEIGEIQKEINKFRSELTECESTVREEVRELKIIEEETEDIKNSVFEENIERLNELNNEKDMNLNSKKEMLDTKQILEMAGLILRDSGIKSRIIKQYVPIINSLVNKYLAAMDFFVKFELDETFHEKILSRHRDDFTYDSFSEGEKMRIDFALLFTWRTIAKMKNSSSTNLLILDEIFDASLDANGCDDFLKLIHNLEDSNVFVISHKGDIMQDKFLNHIKFEKVNNFSRIAA